MATLIDEPVHIVEYDPDWPRLYQSDAAELTAALGDRIREVQHFGSTAVPALRAKEIIDVLLAPVAWPLVATDRDVLIGLGYEDLGEAGVPGRMYFRRRRLHSTNLAVVEWNGVLWQDNLLFRDYLRAHPNAAQEYGKLKSTLWNSGLRSLLAYSDAKASHVAMLVEAARKWGAG